MTASVGFKAALIWLGIACLAVINGVLRENLMVPLWGRQIALPLSGVTLCLLVFLSAWFSRGFIGAKTGVARLLVGIQWVLMTLAFEFLFGHYAVGKSWAILLQSFNIATGDLFSLVLVVSLLSPWLAARI